MLKHNTRFYLIERVVLWCCICVFMFGCGQNKNDASTKKNTVITVHANNASTPLYFKGRILPARIENIASPAEGTIEEMQFNYGQPVKKNQILFKLNSLTIEKQYQEDFTDYIKQKENYLKLKKKFEDTKSLRTEGIIADNEYQETYIEYNDAYIAYVQTEKKLGKLLELLNIDPKQIFSIDIQQRDKIISLLRLKTDTIYVRSPVDGIALHPTTENENSTSGKIKTLILGTHIKQDDTALAIGDLSEIKIDIEVDEVSMLQLKVGQPVTITSVSLPNMILNGKIAFIGSQANGSAEDNIPTFTVSIIVPSVLPDIQNRIHVGTTAQLAVQPDQTHSIQIPFSAIKEKNGKPYVTSIDPNTHIKTDKPVVLGSTTANAVTVQSGLQEGEQLVLAHNAR